MNPREPHLLGQKPGTAPFTVYGTELTSRLLLGTALYPSPQIMADAVKASAVTPAALLGVTAAVGTIEVGTRANVVVVTGNALFAAGTPINVAARL